MKARTITVWMLLSLACLQFGTCRAADELVGRQAELLKVYRTTPVWVKAYAADLLTEAARWTGDALATISEADWRAYLEWVRTDPAPAATLSAAMAALCLDARDPEAYTGKRRTRNGKALYQELLPLIDIWRAMYDAAPDPSAIAKPTAAWSDEQLTAFLADAFDRAGVTAAKLKHDQWMLVTAPGRRLLILLTTAVAQRS